MTLESLRIKSEEFALRLLPALERAFGIVFDSDLDHVRTVGDLFDEITRRQPRTEGSGQSETGMAFHALRRALAPLWAEVDATPATLLRGNELPLPRRLKPLLEQKTGYALPRPVFSMFGWLLIIAISAMALFEFAYNQMVVGALLVCAGIVAALLDPGEFSGDWATLGSLAREVANLNFATVGDGSVQDPDAAGWRRFADLLASHALDGESPPNPADIGRETSLRFG